MLGVILLSACGAEDARPPEAEVPAIYVRFESDTGWDVAAAAAVTTPPAPVTLVLSFAGPDGALHKEVSYAAGAVKVPDLREGAWSVRGDGLDKAGQVTWSAKPVAFEVRVGKQVAVEMAFVPMTW